MKHINESPAFSKDEATLKQHVCGKVLNYAGTIDETMMHWLDI
jgi:hypothetical protein